MALRTLRTAFEAHQMRVEEAVRGYPVHVRGVVTFYDRSLDAHRTGLFLHDATGSIFVAMDHPAPPGVRAGSLLDVRGVSAMRDFAPVVSKVEMTVLGIAALPPRAPPAGLGQLLSGTEDGQWVEVEGIVRSVYLAEHLVTLQLALVDGEMSATTLREPEVDYSRLVDARLSLHANQAPLFNGSQQMTGAHLLFPSLRVAWMLEPAPPDPFTLPIRSIGQLFRFDPEGNPGHRVHLRGRVTLQWVGKLLCIEDQQRGLCARSDEQDPVEVGRLVDVVGFAAAGSSAPILEEAAYRPVDSGGRATPVAVDRGSRAFRVQNDARLITVDGRLMGQELFEGQTTLLLKTGDMVFSVVLPPESDSVGASWTVGSLLRVTGICSMSVSAAKSGRSTGLVVPEHYLVRARTARDVEVLERPPRWLARRALVILCLAVAVTLLGMVWVILLRRRVREQTETIRRSEERFRHLALHDTLTGLPSRLLLRERLEAALADARRRKGVVLLMLDLDHFKAINDTLGHHAGDETLRVTAQRLVQSVRQTDTVARLGGDEFVVLLEGIHEISTAERIAAKIVESVACPMDFEGRATAVSASVGICRADMQDLNAEALLRRADTAMYKAKAQGRNRVAVAEPALSSV